MMPKTGSPPREAERETQLKTAQVPDLSTAAGTHADNMHENGITLSQTWQQNF